MAAVTRDSTRGGHLTHNELLAMSPFDSGPGPGQARRLSASEKFNAHLAFRRGPDPDGAAAAHPPPADRREREPCYCCGGIGGHLASCGAVLVSIDDAPVQERWFGKVVTLPGSGGGLAGRAAAGPSEHVRSKILELEWLNGVGRPRAPASSPLPASHRGSSSCCLMSDV